MGASFLPEWLVADDLLAKRLVRAMPAEALFPETTLYAVCTSRQYTAPKLRIFIDFTIKALACPGGAPKGRP